ncbi:FCD domain-containing protein [Ignatzschineria rhizosphaerae]|uniref:FCD domain-containing protein n=1 Tax=Ignatzschineria rhizosphaerae TaxID=2923279 RepID=A0ABY3WXS2_9GAMM|nr:FCD domain-containing protein [Ignatzschineria rhizosphaerae]UNM95412.1 FCD domain-containing protein [Ignatzschineria rhizosphaerae]
MKLSVVERLPHEEVIVEFMDMIETGAFLPGEILPEIPEIVKSLKKPEADILQAIDVLKGENIFLDREGLLFLTHNDKDLILSRLRNRVLNIHSSDIIDLLEIREGLETRAFVLATKRATNDDLKDIEEALIALEERTKLHKAATKEDLRFHLALVKASHNPTMVRVVEIIFKQLFESLNETRTTVRKLVNVDYFVDVHRELYNALLARDADKGVELMKAHIEDTIGLYQVPNSTN